MSAARNPSHIDPSQARASSNISEEVPMEEGTRYPPACLPSDSRLSNKSGKEVNNGNRVLTNMSFEGFNAGSITFNFKGVRENSPGPSVLAPRIASESDLLSTAPAKAVNSPFGIAKKSDPGFPLRTRHQAEAASSSSDLGPISRCDASPLVDTFLTGPQQTQRLSELLRSSIRDSKDTSASQPGPNVDSGLKMTNSNSQQSHNLHVEQLMNPVKARSDPFTGSVPMRMKTPTGPASRNQFVGHHFDSGRTPPAGSVKHVAPDHQLQPTQRFVELLALLIVPTPEDQGSVMHANVRAFDKYVFVGVPVDELRIRVVRELFEIGGQILKTNFIWETEDGRNTLVRVGQENWHRILNSVKGDDFRWFTDIWKANVRRQPKWLSFFEECSICKAEDAESNPDAGANQMQAVYDIDDRTWNFRHILRNQLYRGGPRIEIIGD